MAIEIINIYYKPDVDKRAAIVAAGNALKAFLQSETGAAKSVWKGGELVAAVPEIKALHNYEQGTIDAVCTIAGVTMK